MSCCTNVERAIGYQIGTITSTTIAIKPGGTAAPVPTLQFPDAEDKFCIIDITNDTDQDIEVSYTNDAGDVGVFVVPKSVKTKTRKLEGGFIVNSSIKLYSLNAVSAAAGNVTINLSN